MQPVQLSSSARQHIKLDHLEEFHCIMPKDMTKPQDTPRTPFDPSTAPAASLNTGASTSQPQDAASQQVNTASQAMHSASQAKGAASQSEAAASHQQSMVSVSSSSSTSAPGQARLGSADSLTNDAVSRPRNSTSTTSSSSSSSSSSASANGPRSSNLQDTNSSNSSNIRTAKAGSISSVGLGDTQVAVGNNGDATSNLSKPVDGAVSKAGDADAATASAPQQAQQAAQGTRRTEQNIEEEEEEQALSGSVSKSGFEFCGSGAQFKVGCKAEAQHRLMCCQNQKSTIIALDMRQITACCMFAWR